MTEPNDLDIFDAYNMRIEPHLSASIHFNASNNAVALRLRIFNDFSTIDLRWMPRGNITLFFHDKAEALQFADRYNITDRVVEEE